MDSVSDFLCQSTRATVCRWDDAPQSGEGFEQLDKRAGQVASALSQIARPGDRVLVGLPTGAEFLVAFFGCLYAGVVPAAVAPPSGRRRTERLKPLVDVAEPVALIGAGTSPAAGTESASSAGPGPAGLDRVAWLDLDALEDGSDYMRRPAGPEDLAYLQFTSGSTAVPRAAMIRHGAVLANLHAMQSAAELSPDAVIASWLPMHHDMGLILGLMALRYGYGLTLERPETFTRAPMRWLEAMSRHRCEFGGAPNFAFDLLNRTRAAPETPLDLSCLRVIFCGAEPIQPAVMRRFAQRYAAAGVRPETVSPGYGMAEFTLMASYVRPVDVARTRVIGDGREVISCGRVSECHAVAIVDPETGQRCVDGSEGEIWLTGPSKGAGYWQDPEATARTFEARLAGDDRTWLRTGDLGSLHDGELFVLGRIKDVLIIRGRNLHAEDLEAVVRAAHPLMATVAATTVETASGEGIGLSCELNRALPKDIAPQEIQQAVQRELGDVFGLSASRIALVRRGGLPRTTSGKIRRADCRDRLRDGSLPILHDWQPDTTPATFTKPDTAHRADEILDWSLRWLQVKSGIETSGITKTTPLDKLGLDSLTALELSHDLEDWLRRPVSSTALFEATSLAALAAQLADNQPGFAEQPAAPGTDGGFDLNRRLSELESMSDGEVERLLASRINLRPVE
ncbi:MAG: AMP-binding protein [Pseudomonadota bacterium]